MSSHDPAKRRQSHRKGREKGCHVYITAEEMRAAGFDPDGAAPYFRIWPGQRGRFVVTLYRERMKGE